jgi:hypothetical protein
VGKETGELILSKEERVLGHRWKKMVMMKIKDE